MLNADELSKQEAFTLAKLKQLEKMQAEGKLTPQQEVALAEFKRKNPNIKSPQSSVAQEAPKKSQADGFIGVSLFQFVFLN